jgi:hypothetical protein
MAWEQTTPAPDAEWRPVGTVRGPEGPQGPQGPAGRNGVDGEADVPDLPDLTILLENVLA